MKSGVLLCQVRWSANIGLPGQAVHATSLGEARAPKGSTSAKINQLCPRRANAAQVQANLTVPEPDNVLNLVDLDRCDRRSKKICNYKPIFFQN